MKIGSKNNIIDEIKAHGFPDDFASDKEKDSQEYGLNVGRAILGEWFVRDGGTCRFYDRWTDIHRLRLYARGEQSIQKYKDELAVNGDLSHLNLDWTPVPIMPKFIDIVVNGMQERLFKVKAYAHDVLSQERRAEYQEMIETQMAGKELLEMIQQNTGVNPFTINPDDLPANDEEMQLHMQLKYKPAIEIAEEEAISTIFDENKYLDIKNNIDYDITVIGVGVAKHEFKLGSGVEINYVDYANVVHSYTEDKYFKDCFYWGEVKRMPIQELLKYNPDLTREDLEDISEASKNFFDLYNLGAYYENSAFENKMCTVLFFNYKTFRKQIYKKKNISESASKVIRKDEGFNPPDEKMKEGRFSKIERRIDVWYEGVMIAGTKKIIKWNLMENMVRPKSSAQHAIPNYVACAPRLYKGKIESLARRMIPFVDLIQITHLKLQQVIAKTVPDGVFLDADGLVEVDLGNGQSYSPNDALRLYFQTGSVVGRSMTTEGEFNHARIPIQELNKSSSGDKVQMLIGAYTHYLNSIRDVTGLNEARDGSMPDPDSLVGLQKMAALNSNTATRHILDAGKYITKTLAEALTYRVSDILQYADFKEDFISRIGRYNVALLDEIKDLYIYDFGIFLEVSPDEEEKAMLESNIQVALSKGDINLEDAIDVREIRNIKLANQLLKLKRAKNLEAMQQFEREKQMMITEAQMATQQAATEAKMVQIDKEKESKVEQLMVEGDEKRKTLELEAALKERLMAQEAQYRRELYEMQQQQLSERDKMKEDEKNMRERQRSSDQSKLIDQRRNNLPPVNFQSNQDTLDGFNLQETRFTV